MHSALQVSILILVHSVLLLKISNGQVMNRSELVTVAENKANHTTIWDKRETFARYNTLNDSYINESDTLVNYNPLNNSDTFASYIPLNDSFIKATTDENPTSGYCPPITPEETEGLAPDSAEILYHKLFRCYNKNVRPVHNTSAPITIHVKVILKSIENIDMKTQREIARLVVELTWTDFHLSWDKHLYRNVSRFTVGADKIWLPDVTVESITGSFEFIKVADIGRAVVDNQGTVTVWPSILANLGTEIVVSKYPFDTQNITFIFGSWSYHSKEVAYKLEETYPPLDSYQTNSEWHMLSYTSFIDQYGYGEMKFDRVGYTFTIQRRWLYFVMNVIGPVVLACLLNLLVFLLPAACGQRVSLAISIFLSLTLFLAQINDSLPKTSVGLSILVVYLCLQLVGSVMTIASSVLIIYLSQRATSTEKSHSSKVVEFFCRSVLPKQALKKYKSEPENKTTADATEMAEVTDKKGNNKESAENHQESKKNHGFAFPLAAGISKVPRKNVMVMASEYINTSCLWMSVIWNIVLLIALTIFGFVA